MSINFNCNNIQHSLLFPTFFLISKSCKSVENTKDFSGNQSFFYPCVDFILTFNSCLVDLNTKNVKFTFVKREGHEKYWVSSFFYDRANTAFLRWRFNLLLN